MQKYLVVYEWCRCGLKDSQPTTEWVWDVMDFDNLPEAQGAKKYFEKDHRTMLYRNVTLAETK